MYQQPPSNQQSQQQQPYPPPQLQQPYPPLPQRQQPMPPPQWQQQRPPYQQPMMPLPMYQPNIMIMQQKQQLSFLIRALYFCFIGWWLGITWAIVALLLICTIIGAPIGLLMLNSLSTVLTMYQK